MGLPLRLPVVFLLVPPRAYPPTSTPGDHPLHTGTVPRGEGWVPVGNQG